MENPTETLNIFINKMTQGITVWRGVLCTEQNKQLGTLVSKGLQNRQ